MEVTWFGTASIRIRIQELVLLFDPFVPLPGAYFTMPAERFLPAPFTFITHGHFDHVYSVPHLVQLGAGRVFATKSPHAALLSQGVLPESLPESLHCVKPGDTVCFSAAAGSLVEGTAKVLPDGAAQAQPNGTARGLPNGAVQVLPDGAAQTLPNGASQAPGNAARALLENASDLVTVTVRRSRHIRFDVPYVLSTLFSARVLRYSSNMKTMLAANRVYRENNETVVFDISHNNRTVTVMGSLALVDNETYAQNADLLVLPYQGHSHLEPIALSIIERLKPKQVLLDHFDNTFPPVSRDIDTTPLVNTMKRRHPGIQVIVPKREITYRV